ncbi:Solute carrier family 35 member F2 [Camelus dromedarius]|uniref:Solute carrier family 35 member F2 n=1 Tax=Camelus dromedarius TaxID=9838 RepID=A0A5N4C7V7_CAMDR|nr:Solute carrier family 35 member F2 [Camelus dromedarius]
MFANGRYPGSTHSGPGTVLVTENIMSLAFWSLGSWRKKTHKQDGNSGSFCNQPIFVLALITSLYAYLSPVVSEPLSGVQRIPIQFCIFTAWHMVDALNILKTIALGQMLSLCICGTAITSQYLAERYKVNTPMLQSFINYCLLFLIYTMMLAFQSGSDNLLYILKKKWWKYILLGLADVEANYLIVRAYQYTTLTSVQLLDCFGIPVLMALSWFILYARYRVIHFIAVAVCLLGVGTMVGADMLAGREDSAAGSDVLIGDILVLLGASLYAVSNVCEEYIVKKLSRQEFLGMVGLFGTIISGIQLLIVEYKDIGSIPWDWKIALLFVAFAVCMFCLYSFMPLVIKVTSATSVNLGILTADLYSLFFGLFMFGYKFSGLYILSFTVIMVGFTLYCSTPTRTAEPAESSVPPVTSIGIDNLGLKLEENLQETHSVVL